MRLTQGQQTRILLGELAITDLDTCFEVGTIVRNVSIGSPQCDLVGEVIATHCIRRGHLTSVVEYTNGFVKEYTNQFLRSKFELYVLPKSEEEEQEWQMNDLI